MTYREPLFQIGTVQNEGKSYEGTQYLSVDNDMGKPGTPHLTADSWENDGQNHRQVRIWLNKEQWAELADFAAKMAEDERIPTGDEERTDVQYFNQEQQAARVLQLREENTRG